MNSYHRFILDVQSVQSQISIPVSLFDTARTFYISFTDGGKPYIIDEGCLVKLTITRPSGSKIHEFCAVKENTTVIYPFTQNQYTAAEEGIHGCEVTIYGLEGEQITSPRFTMVVSDRVVNADDNNGIDDESIGIVDDMVKNEQARLLAEAERAEAEVVREEIAKRALAAAERVEGSVKGDRVYIRYSAYPDGRDYVEEWSRGLNYIGFSVGLFEPEDQSGYQWSVFAPGIYVGGGDMPDYADIQILPDGEETGIVQTTGDSEEAVMSQKAVTMCLDDKVDKLTSPYNYPAAIVVNSKSSETRLMAISGYPTTGCIASYAHNGVLRTSTPTEDIHCANKEYVDGLVGDIDTALDELHSYAQNLVGGDV